MPEKANISDSRRRDGSLPVWILAPVIVFAIALLAVAVAGIAAPRSDGGASAAEGHVFRFVFHDLAMAEERFFMHQGHYVGSYDDLYEAGFEMSEEICFGPIETYFDPDTGAPGFRLLLSPNL